ncbi:MAG: GNAT family N-acetyltransferase [Anaerolineae bacterium]|nr:GNAT family N-acetyltransferase [Anaerolineae bacterium]
MLSHVRLETYMRRAAMLGREGVETPPFVCLFSPNDPLRFFNYAKPLEPVGAEPDGLNESLATLRQAFRTRQRVPRFEFIEEFAPDLGPALVAAGFSLEDRYPLLVCTPETLRQMPPIDGLTITTLTPDSPVDDLLACLAVQQQGFGEMAGDPPTLADVDDLRANLACEGAFLARMAGVPAGAMMYTAPFDGLTELVGGTTLEAYRRRGIGAAMIAAAAADAFGRSVEIVLLTAASEHASGVFQRAGFWWYGTSLAYAEES